MNLRQLRCFVILAEELHFGRAAQRLFVTQPALSASIRQLEEQLGIGLFERNSRQVGLTGPGQAFLARATSLVAHAQRTLELGKALSDGLAGQMEVGFVGTMLLRGFAAIVQRFWASYPRINLQLHEMSSSKQIEQLREGHLDAAFINHCTAPTEFAAMPVYSERFVACVPADSPLAKRKSLPVRALAGQPFIMFQRGASSPYYDYILGLCTQAGFEPSVRMEAMQLTSVAAFVAGGAGVAILPECIAHMAMSGARFVPLAGVPAVPSAFLVWNKDSAPLGFKALIECVGS